MSTNNISNKKKSIKITEKNIKNPENRAQIIKQLKKEKDELFGKNDSNRKSQLTKNLIIMIEIIIEVFQIKIIIIEIYNKICQMQIIIKDLK
jgi:uncharacterized membrane protein